MNAAYTFTVGYLSGALVSDPMTMTFQIPHSSLDAKPPRYNLA